MSQPRPRAVAYDPQAGIYVVIDHEGKFHVSPGADLSKIPGLDFHWLHQPVPPRAPQGPSKP